MWQLARYGDIKALELEVVARQKEIKASKKLAPADAGAENQESGESPGERTGESTGESTGDDSSVLIKTQSRTLEEPESTDEPVDFSPDSYDPNDPKNPKDLQTEMKSAS